jgi:serine/threonine-protein kinase SRPK3
VSIKIGALDGNVARELVTCEHIAGANRDHEGLAFLRIPIDDFKLLGPGGTHTCLVYEPMRETLFRFQQRTPQGRIPLPLLKLFTYCLLQALDYLHTDCRLIHTGKPQPFGTRPLGELG